MLLHRAVLAMFCILVFSAQVEAKIQWQSIPYKHGEIELEGGLAWDDSITGKRPGILVVHEWWGLNDYARKRAEQLAALGYVAFAVDMYGKGKVTDHGDQASQWAKEVTTNVSVWQARALEGLKVLEAHPQVNPQKLAAIGYCFGGATVMQLVYSGAPVKGVVSFHGSLPIPPKSQTINSAAKVLIAHGEADPFLTAEHIRNFQSSLGRSGLDWHMVIYGGAQHSFTNPSANQYGMKGVQYQEQADRRSWKHMRVFFDEIFQ
ncbi:MAG: dienelactone hydrolase family protein [Nitrospirales bacterium]